MNFGEKLKILRKKNSWTLDELSEKSGIAKATLSRIENGITVGNLNTHLKICDALGINVAELYKEKDKPEEKIKSFDEKYIKPAEIFDYDEKISSLILTKQTGKKKMLPQLLIIEENESSINENNQAGTEKFIFCLEGKIELKIFKKVYFLKKNTCSYFDASLPHTFSNVGQKKARLLVISSPATF